MASRNTTRYVFIHLPGSTEAVPAGELVMRIDQRGEFTASSYQYGRRYLQRGNALDVDPISLPRRDAEDREFVPVNGLAMFGAIRDAAPDMWGRRVIENILQRAGPLPEWMYLDHAGSDRAGALDIRARLDSKAGATKLPSHIDLAYLLDAAQRIEAGEPVPANLQHYFHGGPTMGGMRPKAVIDMDGRQFIAKFPSRKDEFDMPAVERATLELARAAGLSVPETRHLRLADGRSIMLIERFDRVPGADAILARRHMVSALTMLGAYELESANKSYTDIAEIISKRAPRDRIDLDRRELFGRMVFNILVNNDDDHLRNHAFLYENGGWVLSPLYDVVPSRSVSHERYLHLGIGAMGRAARADNAMTSAAQFGLRDDAAMEIIDRIHRQVRSWRMVFEESGVAKKDCDLVSSAFLHAKHNGVEAVLSAKTRK